MPPRFLQLDLYLTDKSEITENPKSKNNALVLNDSGFDRAGGRIHFRPTAVFPGGAAVH